VEVAGDGDLGFASFHKILLYYVFLFYSSTFRVPLSLSPSVWKSALTFSERFINYYSPVRSTRGVGVRTSHYCCSTPTYTVVLYYACHVSNCIMRVLLCWSGVVLLRSPPMEHVVSNVNLKISLKKKTTL